MEDDKKKHNKYLHNICVNLSVENALIFADQ